MPREHRLIDADEFIPWDAFVEELESHYSGRLGQPPILPLLILKIEYLRYLYRLSDREVIARAQTDVAFRWFLGIPVQCRLPDPTVLVRFRGRLGSKGFNAIFDRLVAEAREQGLVRDRLRLKDASHVIAKIAVPSTLQLLAQLRERMLAAIENIDPAIAQGFRIELERTREETASASPEIRLEQRVALVQEISDWIKQQPSPSDPSQHDANWEELQEVQQLATKILDDTTHPNQGDKIRSLVDPDARRGKHGPWYDGYSLDIMIDADSELITKMELLSAGGDEAKDAVALVRSEEAAHGNDIENLSIDGVGSTVRCFANWRIRVI